MKKTNKNEHSEKNKKQNSEDELTESKIIIKEEHPEAL